MQSKLKLAAIAGALACATALGGGIRAGATPASTSTSTTTSSSSEPATPAPDAPAKSVGTCHGLTGLASVKSDYTDPNDGLPAGLVANVPTAGANHDVRISVKGVANPDGNFGSCNFSGDNTPGAGTYTVAKWTALLVTPAGDCLSDNDPAEYPLNGKTTIEFTDGSRTQTYSQTTFGLGTAHDLLTQSGVVTKGNGLGALFDNEIFYAPITKVPSGTVVAPSDSPYPGYAYDNVTAAACAGSPPGATADARDLIVGDGVSGLTGQSASGYAFQVGS